MTLMQMLNEGNVLYLAVMAGIFIMMVVLVQTIGKGVEAKFAADKEATVISSAGRTQDGTIAAITAAVKQYRKNK